MKIEIAEHGRMSESGSSLLRLIQNQDIPLLDLLIRESVQNSLDAAQNGRAFVSVDVSVKSFVPKELNKHFEGIVEKLNARYKNTCKSIVVRDSNTVGLTGPVKYSDVKGQDFGNCLKLIYEICKPQTNEGAGGSWGLGKTIYFRLGMGLVIYYSRIKVNGNYKSRLAACLVEDETKNDAMLPAAGGVKRGIAWWGASGWLDKNTVPIENENDIRKIIGVFGIQPYMNGETGTTIIIPYIDEKRLLREVYADNEEKENKPYWVNSVMDYIRIAFERWYAPRMMNQYYKGAYLKPSVDNQVITVSKLRPLFRVIRELYIYSVTNELPEDSFIAEQNASCESKAIYTRDVFVPGSSSAGNFVFVKMNKRQLRMEPPDNEKDPYQQITNRVVPMENGNTPIIMFTRRPGMIVGYDFDGAWTHRMPKSVETEYIIGLFIADSENRLKGIHNNYGECLSLEEYIRKGEKADHASWTDRTIDGINPRVISKTQTTIINTISKKFKEKVTETIERSNIGLSQALANILLPSLGFGGKPATPPKPTPSRTVSKKKDVSISILNKPVFCDDEILLDFELKTGKNGAILKLLLITDYSKLDAEEWEASDSVGTPFPLEFKRLQINRIKGTERNAQWESVKYELNNEIVLMENGSIEFLESKQFGTRNTIKLCTNKKIIIAGKVVFTSVEKSVLGTIGVTEVLK